MNPFVYFAPTRVDFGRGVEEKAGAMAKAHGATRVLVHYGSMSARRSGLLDRILSSLQDEGLSWVELGGVVPNPRLSLVYKGIELGQSEGVDFILAVGGGSAMDSAKAIAVGMANEGDVWDFFAKKRTPSCAIPLGVVPTLAATGSEMSNSAVITKEEGDLKRGCRSDWLRPLFALMNPDLTMTLPAYQTACGCTDILMHTMERYFTARPGMEITDSLAEALLRTVMDNALLLRDNPKNYDARAEIFWAGSLSHNGLTGCGNGGDDFVTHALEHELGGMFDVAHGAGLAALWGSWARYVYRSCLPKFRRFALRVMGVAEEGSAEDIAEAGIRAMETFLREINMPTSLRELGLDPTDEQLALLAQKCSAACGGKKGAAREIFEPDMLAIYRDAR